MNRVGFESLASGSLADPYPYYSYLRAEDPVHLGPRGVWIITRYDDVAAVLRNERFGRKRFREFLPGNSTPGGQQPEVSLLFQDPPDHTRLRSLAGKVFTLDLVQSLRPHIQQVVYELLDRAREASSFDLIADFARPLPVEAIIELLGLPQADRQILHQWSSDLALCMEAPPVASISQSAVDVHQAIAAYFADLVAERYRHPGNDLVTRLLAVEDENGRLTEFELIDICGLLFIAGHETTVNLIGNGMLTLLLHPGELCRLRKDPALLPSAVEELLRYESPVQRVGRIAGADVEIGNKIIPEGAVVSAALGAANRDPARFPEPDRLDIARRNNHHLAFGSGGRYCLGAALARLEAQIAIGTLVRHLPDMELAAHQPAWRHSEETRGLKELRVRSKHSRGSCDTARNS